MAGGYLEYVYEVEPAMPITKCNLVWYGQLADAALGNGHVLRKKSWVEEYATKYWNAVPYSSDGKAFWDCYEYLSPYAIVKRLVHDSVTRVWLKTLNNVVELTGKPCFANTA